MEIDQGDGEKENIKNPRKQKRSLPQEEGKAVFPITFKPVRSYAMVKYASQRLTIVEFGWSVVSGSGGGSGTVQALLYVSMTQEGV